MRSTTVAMGWCLATVVACGGRYDASAGNGAGPASSGGSTTGASSTGASSTGASSTGATNPGTSAGAPSVGTGGDGINVGTAGGATMVAVGGGPTGTGSEPASACAMTVSQRPEGPFASPSVVWGRVAMLTWGKPLAPGSPLPPSTSPAWAGDLAQEALADAMHSLGSAPGVDAYLRQAFALDATMPLQMAWAAQVPNAPSLPALLLTARLGGTGRVGIFTEPAWLALHPNISSRGVGINRSLFDTEVPPPPPNTSNEKLDPSLPDREALEQSLSQPVCAACHHLMDPPGFALGHFAADGSYREQDHGLPIDVSGSLRTMNGGSEVAFNGIEDFGRKALGTCDATFGIADSFLRAALVINGAPEAARDSLFHTSEWPVRQGFIAGGRTYAALVSAYIQSPAGLNP